MLIQIDCIPCLLKLSLSAVRKITNDPGMIEDYFEQKTPVATIALYNDTSTNEIYTGIKFLKSEQTALDYYTQYQKNNKRCERRKIVLPQR